MITSTIKETTARELTRATARARAPRLRTMREFAEQEIVIPDGPFTGRRFKCDRQPYSRLWFDAIDSGKGSRFVATGPTQSGKTLTCNLVPLLYHLFEVGETVIFGLPDMDMAADKWNDDLKPIIDRTKYHHLLPASGGGSRGGRVQSIRFRNGTTLKFMSGGGGDKSRAGFTARVLLVTETDGMDAAGKASREADKITQLEARTLAYGDQARIYLECTVSTEYGRTWQEYQNGTRSRIVTPCPHCSAHVTLEREHFLGWDSAEDEIEAGDRAVFCCSECGEAWSSSERRTANQKSKLLHRGQELTEAGSVVGSVVKTNTLGFRWSAVNNSFLSTKKLGAKEWHKDKPEDDETEDNLEKELCQFFWCEPYVPEESDDLKLEDVTARGLPTWPRATVPNDATSLAVGLDIRKRFGHWVALAQRPNAMQHVVEFAAFDIPSDDLGQEVAITRALLEFADRCESGWTHAENAKPMLPRAVFCDAGWNTNRVYEICKTINKRKVIKWIPSFGRGIDQLKKHSYTTPAKRPQQKDHKILWRGQGVHLSKTENHPGLHHAIISSDEWKTRVQAAVKTPREQAGALTIHAALASELTSFGKHLTSERSTEEFVAGKGLVTKWVTESRSNHWLDALYMASANLHYLESMRAKSQKKTQGRKPTQFGDVYQ